MSQEKVTKYKEEKARRKETMKKQKRIRFVRNTVAGLVCLAVVGWVGYSGVTYYLDNQPRVEVAADYTAIDEYLETISAE